MNNKTSAAILCLISAAEERGSRATGLDSLSSPKKMSSKVGDKKELYADGAEGFPPMPRPPLRNEVEWKKVAATLPRTKYINRGYVE